MYFVSIVEMSSIIMHQRRDSYFDSYLNPFEMRSSLNEMPRPLLKGHHLLREIQFHVAEGQKKVRRFGGWDHVICTMQKK